MMKHSLKVGFSFGVTSGIITTLGLMVGLHSGTHSKVVIIGGDNCHGAESKSMESDCRAFSYSFDSYSSNSLSWRLDSITI